MSWICMKIPTDPSCDCQLPNEDNLWNFILWAVFFKWKARFLLLLQKKCHSLWKLILPSKKLGKGGKLCGDAMGWARSLQQGTTCTRAAAALQEHCSFCRRAVEKLLLEKKNPSHATGVPAQCLAIPAQCLHAQHFGSCRFVHWGLQAGGAEQS